MGKHIAWDASLSHVFFSTEDFARLQKIWRSRSLLLYLDTHCRKQPRFCWRKRVSDLRCTLVIPSAPLSHIIVYLVYHIRNNIRMTLLSEVNCTPHRPTTNVLLCRVQPWHSGSPKSRSRAQVLRGSGTRPTAARSQRRGKRTVPRQTAHVQDRFERCGARPVAGRRGTAQEVSFLTNRKSRRQSCICL